jgi:hypothetical protein
VYASHQVSPVTYNASSLPRGERALSIVCRQGQLELFECVAETAMPSEVEGFFA